MIISQGDLFMLYVDMNKSHVSIVMSHVDVIHLAWRGKKELNSTCRNSICRYFIITHDKLTVSNIRSATPINISSVLIPTSETSFTRVWNFCGVNLLRILRTFLKSFCKYIISKAHITSCMRICRNSLQQSKKTELICSQVFLCVC